MPWCGGVVGRLSPTLAHVATGGAGWPRPRQRGEAPPGASVGERGRRQAPRLPGERKLAPLRLAEPSVLRLSLSCLVTTEARPSLKCPPNIVNCNPDALRAVQKGILATIPIRRLKNGKQARFIHAELRVKHL